MIKGKSQLTRIFVFLWFVFYLIGGAWFLAKQAMKEDMPFYMPIVIILWMAGFFIGHGAIEAIDQHLDNRDS